MILRGLLAPLSAAIAVSGIWAAFHFDGLRVNASPSLPIGIYRTTSDKSAKLVEFCPAEPFASLSASRSYRGKGTCGDGAEPLMKPIAAVAGDTIDISADGVAINGKLLANSAPRPLDTKNRKLQPWPFGEYQVTPGTIWVISSFNARSFDSRYFGPISIASVRCHLKPLITE